VIKNAAFTAPGGTLIKFIPTLQYMGYNVTIQSGLSQHNDTIIAQKGSLTIKITPDHKVYINDKESSTKAALFYLSGSGEQLEDTIYVGAFKLSEILSAAEQETEMTIDNKSGNYDVYIFVH
jgi:hypothetical protein